MRKDGYGFFSFIYLSVLNAKSLIAKTPSYNISQLFFQLKADKLIKLFKSCLGV